MFACMIMYWLFLEVDYVFTYVNSTGCLVGVPDSIDVLSVLPGAPTSCLLSLNLLQDSTHSWLAHTPG